MPVSPASLTDVTMTPADLKTWRKAAGLTQAEAAAWYGLRYGPKVAAKVWGRWEQGERAVPAPLAARVRATDPRTASREMARGPG